MDAPETAKQLVDLARKHIEDQQSCIVSGARLVLERMQKQLAQMTAAHVAVHICQNTNDIFD